MRSYNSRVARRMVERVYVGARNIVTPDVWGHVLASRRDPRLAVEVSTGSDLYGLYVGFTAIEERAGDGELVPRPDLSKCVTLPVGGSVAEAVDAFVARIADAEPSEGGESPRQRARRVLEERCPRGSAVYTVDLHVSRSGITHEVKCLVAISNDGKVGIEDITCEVALVLGLRRSPNTGGVIVRGYGDVGYSLVENLSRELFDGVCALIPVRL